MAAAVSPATKQHSHDIPVHKSFMQRYLIWPKILFFLLTSVVYILKSLSTNFYVDKLQMSLTEVSFIAAVGGINFVGALLWTWLADRTNKHKLILIVSAVGFTIFSSLNQVKIFDYNTQRAAFLAYLLGVNTIANLFQSALFPLMDGLMMTMLSQDPTLTKEMFGRQRLFSTIGHTFSTMLSQILLHFTNDWYPVLNIALGIFTVLFVISVQIGLPSSADPNAKKHGHGHGASEKSGNHTGVSATAVTPEGPRRSPTVALITNFNFLFFILFVLTIGLVRNCMTVFRTFLSLGVQKHKVLNSLPNLGRAAAEILMLFFGKQWMAAMGVYWVLVFSQITGLLQVLGYALLPLSAEWYYAVYPLEILKGLTSGLLTSAAVRIAADMAPKGCESTAQGFYSGTLGGLSVVAGSLLSALLFSLQVEGLSNAVKIQGMFLWTTIISAIFTVMIALKFIFVDRVMSIPGLPRKYAAPGKPL